jgi:hypothetical protein
MNLTPITDPSGGLSFANEDALMEVVSLAVAVGDVLAVKLDTVNSAFLFNRVKAVAAADFASATDTETTKFFCVALDSCASSAAAQKIRVRFRGIALAKVDGDTNDVAVGDKLRPVDGAATLVTSAIAGPALTNSTFMSVAIALEANASTAALKRVLFNGIEGFGAGFSVS